MESNTDESKYHPNELKFMQNFKIELIDELDFDKLKRIYSLKFKTTNISEKWIELKNKCENDESRDFIRTWLDDESFETKLLNINNIYFRQENNYVMWPKDDHIVILYGEYVPDVLLSEKKKEEYGLKFKFFWNYDKLNPIIESFVRFANTCILEESVSGKIEFVNMGDNVSLTYLG